MICSTDIDYAPSPTWTSTCTGSSSPTPSSPPGGKPNYWPWLRPAKALPIKLKVFLVPADPLYSPTEEELHTEPTAPPSVNSAPSTAAGATPSPPTSKCPQPKRNNK